MEKIVSHLRRSVGFVMRTQRFRAGLNSAAPTALNPGRVRNCRAAAEPPENKRPGKRYALRAPVYGTSELVP
jgi:hypothetical protein